MAKRSKWSKQLNELDSLNVEHCEMLTSSHKLRDFFPDQPFLVAIFENYRSQKLNELTLFWCVLISFMHWSSESKLYHKESNEYTNAQLYGILRGNSVSYKSGYIKRIREAFGFVERYFQEKFVDNKDVFISTCIESFTAAKLLSELETSSKFISSDEDRPLNDIHFYEPSSLKAKEIHPSLISAFNGIYQMQRSTMTYQKHVRDRSLTLLIPTTGDQWPKLLEYFHDSYQTNGLYERILYWVIGKGNFVDEIVDLQTNLPSLEYLCITRLEIGTRVYEYTDEALAYLKPILMHMRNNETSREMSTSVPSNKRAEACQRRAADLLERVAATLQNIFDTLNVLHPINSINFHRIQKETFEQIKQNIDGYFYPTHLNDPTTASKQPYTDSDRTDLKELKEVEITSVKHRPKHTMKISLATATSAVRFFDLLLFPQSIRLFNVDTSRTNSTLVAELKILRNPVNCFSFTDLARQRAFHNHHRSHVNMKLMLANLERKELIRKGRFINAGNRSVEGWVKLLPDPGNDLQIEYFRNELESNYGISLKQFVGHYIESASFVCASVTEHAEHILTTQRSWLGRLQEKLSDGCTISHSTRAGAINACATTDGVSIDRTAAHDDSSHEVIVSPGNVNTLSAASDSGVHNSDDGPIDLSASRNNSSHAQRTNVSTTGNREGLPSQSAAISNESRTRQESRREAFHHDLRTDLADLARSPAQAAVALRPALVSEQQDVHSTATQASADHVSPVQLSDEMKKLCRKILLIDSVILSNTKLYKTLKVDTAIVRRACEVLVEHNLLSLEKEILANQYTFFDAYLKQLPRTPVEASSFATNLLRFDIFSIASYYETVINVDTGNSTYLSSHGASILRKTPYDSFPIIIDDDAVIEPASAGRRLTISSKECNEPGVANVQDLISDSLISSDAQQQPSTPNRSKRHFSAVSDEEEQPSTATKRKRDMQD